MALINGRQQEIGWSCCCPVPVPAVKCMHRRASIAFCTMTMKHQQRDSIHYLHYGDEFKPSGISSGSKHSGGVD